PALAKLFLTTSLTFGFAQTALSTTPGGGSGGGGGGGTPAPPPQAAASETSLAGLSSVFSGAQQTTEQIFQSALNSPGVWIERNWVNFLSAYKETDDPVADRRTLGVNENHVQQLRIDLAEIVDIQGWIKLLKYELAHESDTWPPPQRKNYP